MIKLLIIILGFICFSIKSQNSPPNAFKYQAIVRDANGISMPYNQVSFQITIYEDSHHSFDRNSPVIVNEKAYNFTECKFRLTKDGNVLMNYFNIPMSNPFLQKLGLMFCVKRGINFGGNPVSREKSFVFANEFMTKTLLK